MIMEKEYKYLKSINYSDAIGVSDMVEWPLYGIIALNLAMISEYSVYLKLDPYFNVAVFAASMLLFIYRLTIDIPINKVIGVIVFFAFCVVAIFMNHSGMGVLIKLIWPLSLIFVFKYTRLPERYTVRIGFLMMLAWLMAVYTAFRDAKAISMILTHITPYRGINPNTTAMVIASSCLFLEPFLAQFIDTKWHKFILYPVSLAALAKTLSRTSMIAFGMVILLELLLKRKIKKSKALGLSILFFIIAAGILFPIVYVYLFKQGIITETTAILGKNVFTGRQYIWISLWEYLKQHTDAFIWGTGYNTSFFLSSTDSFSLHNSYLQIFAQFGLPVLLVYIGYLFYLVNGMYDAKGRMTDLQFKCYQVVLLTLGIGTAEIILTYPPSILFFPLALGIGNHITTGGEINDPQSDSLLLVR